MCVYVYVCVCVCVCACVCVCRAPVRVGVSTLKECVKGGAGGVRFSCVHAITVNDGQG